MPQMFLFPHVVGNQSPLTVEGPNPSKNGVTTDMFEREEGELSKENGERRSNGVDLQTDLADDSPAKSRFTFHANHPSFIIYLYDSFWMRFLCKSWSAGAIALVLEGLGARA